MSVKEGVTREKIRAFGRLAPIATRDAAGLPNRTQRTRRHLLEVWPQDEFHKLAFTTAKVTLPQVGFTPADRSQKYRLVQSPRE